MIRLGLLISISDGFLLLMSRDPNFIRVGLSLVGLGLSPLYPAMMHETPRRFSENQSNFLISYQVGMAYVGGTFISTSLGYLFSAFKITILFPVILALLFLMLMISERYNQSTPLKIDA